MIKSFFNERDFSQMLVHREHTGQKTRQNVKRVWETLLALKELVFVHSVLINRERMMCTLNVVSLFQVHLKIIFYLLRSFHEGMITITENGNFKIATIRHWLQWDNVENKSWKQCSKFLRIWRMWLKRKRPSQSLGVQNLNATCWLVTRKSRVNRMVPGLKNLNVENVVMFWLRIFGIYKFCAIAKLNQ